MKHRRYLLLPALPLLAWPIIIDAADMACWLSPSSCSLGRPIVSVLIIASLVIGGVLTSLTLLPPQTRRASWIRTIACGLGIAALVYIVVFIVSFSRDYNF